MASSSSSPPWMVLGRIAKVGDPVEQGSDIALTVSAQPQVSILTVSPRLFPEPKAYRDDYNPSILAIDSSKGILLLQVILRRATPDEPIVLQQRPRHILTTGLVTSYFVVDVTAKTAYAIPDPAMLRDSGRAGILHSSGYGAYVVAELQIVGDSGDVVLLIYFDSMEGRWASNRVPFPSPLPPSRFNPDCVLSHDGKLWWVDLSCGLIAWDALTKPSSLSFFNLPPGKSFHCNGAEKAHLGKHRCVAISNRKIHFVDMDSKNRYDDGRPKVSVWKLQADQDPTWLLEYETSFDNIWSLKSYKLKLPRRMPVLAFIHPTKPWTIYFFVDRHLFGIDLRGNNQLVDCVEYGPQVPSTDRVSSRFFHVCSGSTGGVADSTGGVSEEFLRGKYPQELFRELYTHWREAKLVIKDINTCSGQMGQTMACASQALKDWNETKDSTSTSYEVDLTEPMDSNAFNKSHKFGVQQSYFHVNFYGKSSGPENKKQLFFAELQGLGGPERTKTVMPLGQDEDAVKDSSAEHICYCCTGLMHPYSGEFVGYDPTATHQHH